MPLAITAAKIGPIYY